MFGIISAMAIATILFVVIILIQAYEDDDA